MLTTESPGSSSHGIAYITALTTLVGLAAAMLNALCLVAILRRRLHQEDNRFVFMALLACADMMMGISFTCDTLIRNTEMIPDNSVRNAACIFNSVLLELAVPGELFLLTLLTLDTFLRIELHMRYVSLVTKLVVNLAILVVAILTLLQLVPFFVITSNANWVCVEHGAYPEWYNNYVTAVYFVFPFVLISVMHGRIFCIVRMQGKQMMPGKVWPASAQSKIAVAYRLKKGLTKKGHNDRKDGGDHLESNEHDTNKLSEAAECRPTLDVPRNNDIITSVELNSPETSASTSTSSETSLPKHSEKRKSDSQDWKAFLTATVLIGLLLASWLPTYAVLIALAMHPALYENDVMSHVVGLSTVFYLSNAMANPLVYIARVPQVKLAMRHLFD